MIESPLQKIRKSKTSTAITSSMATLLLPAELFIDFKKNALFYRIQTRENFPVTKGIPVNTVMHAYAHLCAHMPHLRPPICVPSLCLPTPERSFSHGH